MTTHRFRARRMLNGTLTRMCRICGEFPDHPNHRATTKVRKVEGGGKK